jgi:hypothetical protein
MNKITIKNQRMYGIDLRINQIAILIRLILLMEILLPNIPPSTKILILLDFLNLDFSFDQLEDYKKVGVE